MSKKESSSEIDINSIHVSDSCSDEKPGASKQTCHWSTTVCRESVL